MELSRMRFEKLEELDSNILEEKVLKKELKTEEVYQCSGCLTVYSEVYGDKTQGIEVGVSFKDLPSDYVCGVCSNSKTSFEKVLL